MEDKILVCKDCGNEFVFTVREQEFFKTMEFQEPVRCPQCRKEAKHRRKHGKRPKGSIEGIL